MIITSPPPPSLDFVASRAAMIDSQLRVSDVNDPSLLAAIEQVAREDFVPQTHIALAYIDRPIDLSELAVGRGLNAPLAVARLILAADIAPHRAPSLAPSLAPNLAPSYAPNRASLDTAADGSETPPPHSLRILLVGAASGYTAAVLATMGAQVVALESNKTLLKMAQENLAGYPSVSLVQGALAEGVARQAPFDRIIIDGAIDYLPDSLVAQLAEDGIVACAIRDKHLSRLSRGVKIAGAVRLRAFADMDMVTLPEFSHAQSFVF